MTTANQEIEDINQFVTFKINDELFCVSMAPVQEIIRVPKAVKMPLAPYTVIGLSNLRGNVLPIISLRRIFQMEELEDDDFTRALVIEHNGNQLGFVVDRVSNVFTAEKENIEERENIHHSISSDLLSGIIKNNDGTITMIIDFDKIIEQEYNILRSSNVFDTVLSTNNTTNTDTDETEVSDDMQIVVFKLGDEDFGVKVKDVQEIVRVPETLTKVPQTSSNVEGIINLRGVVLPVINQRSQLGFNVITRNDRERIMVCVYEDIKTGFIVDSVTEIITASSSEIKPVPSTAVVQNNCITGYIINKNTEKITMLISIEHMFKEIIQEYDKIIASAS
jgi:purine-binding chemotaxis protein CheW